MTAIFVLVALVVVGVALRWRKLRRDAQRRRWTPHLDDSSLTSSPRVRIVGEGHVPSDPIAPVQRPTLDHERRYVFDETSDDRGTSSPNSTRRDRALELAGRRRRKFRRGRRRS